MKGYDRTEKKFISATANKIVQGQDHELFKPKVRNKRILDLSHKVRNKGDGTGSSTTRVTNTKVKAMELANITE